MADSRQKQSEAGVDNDDSINSSGVPIARFVGEESLGLRMHEDNIPVVVVGERIPNSTVFATSATTVSRYPEAEGAATAPAPATAAAYSPQLYSSTSIMSGTSSSSLIGGTSSQNLILGSGTSSSGVSWGGRVSGGSYGAQVMGQTGTSVVPGCGIKTSTGGGQFGGESAGAGGEGDRRDPPARQGVGGFLRSMLRRGDDGNGGEEENIFESYFGPVLVGCGQGQSMYDVKGCLSSWVLLSEGRGGPGGSTQLEQGLSNSSNSGRRRQNRKGEDGDDDDDDDGSGGGGVAPNTNDGPMFGSRGYSYDAGDVCASGPEGNETKSSSPSSWVLSSKVTNAGSGGEGFGAITCSACVPSSSNQIFSKESQQQQQQQGSRTLITGGKDCVLREWEVANDGQPHLVAELNGHTDWIYCCALVPPTSVGAPPSVTVSGGRDGSVRFWSRPSSLSSSSPSAGGGSNNRSRWSLASTISSAHGSSEFITCCASPSGPSGAAGGWVATGGTDWSVRIWDIAKSRELGRLSFKGHSHSVRSLAASPDGSLLISGGDDHKVVVWSPKSRRAVATLQGHASAVHGIAIDPGTHSGHPPRWIASGGGEGFLLVWDPRNWGHGPVATLRSDKMRSSVGSPEGKTTLNENGGILSGSVGATLRCESGRWEGETTGTTMLKSVNCLAAAEGSGDGSGGGEGDWLFGAGETVVRAWRRRDGLWEGGYELFGEGVGGVACLAVVG